MLVNLAILIIISLLFSKLFEKFNLPGLLGMILTGIIFGPHCLAMIKHKCIVPEIIESNFFVSSELLDISSELRTAALIVILIRAGLGISKATLNRIGIPAIKMSCIPGIFEGLMITLVASHLLGLPLIQAAILGFVIAAVSPAVVVPQMLGLKESGHGEDKEIPTLILASSSVDDVFAITIFGALLGMVSVQASSSLTIQLLNIPISIITGITVGLALGWLLTKYFKLHPMRDTKKTLIVIIVAIILYHLQKLKLFPIASLIGIMAIGFMILEKDEALAKILATKFNQIWVIAELILFLLIGAEVQINMVFKSGFYGIIIILAGLTARSIGVWISLLKSHLNYKERLFCIIAYIPKATVQAAIGGTALALVKTKQITLINGIETGQLILAIAVLSIITTAPLGAIGIRLTAPILLKKTKTNT